MASMPELLYSSGTRHLTWFIDECLPLSFTEGIPTLEGVSVAEKANATGTNNSVKRVLGISSEELLHNL